MRDHNHDVAHSDTWNDPPEDPEEVGLYDRLKRIADDFEMIRCPEAATLREAAEVVRDNDRLRGEVRRLSAAANVAAHAISAATLIGAAKSHGLVEAHGVLLRALAPQPKEAAAGAAGKEGA